MAYEFWTEEEKKIVLANYATAKKEDLLKMLPNRTWAALENLAKKLGLSRETFNNALTWSDEEVELLRKVYPKTEKTKILEMFPSKEWLTIQRKATKLKIKRPKKTAWSEEMVDILKDNYSTATREELMKKIGKSWSAIETKALNLGLNRGKFSKTTWTNPEIDILRKKYYSTPREELKKLLPKRSWRAILEKTNSLGILRDEELVKKENIEGTQKAVMEKYGCKSTFQVPEIKDKIKMRNLDRHGVEYPTQNPEIFKKGQETLQNNYGVTTPLKSRAIIRKAKDTLQKNYGVESPLQSEKIQEKMKNSNLNKYGVENVFQSEEIKEKIVDTNIKKYGVPNPQQNEEIKVKSVETLIENYGVTVPAHSEEIAEKTRQTNLEIYGTETPLQNEEVKKKIKATNLDRYGVENPAQLEEVQEKMKKTNLERFGVEYSMQNEEVRLKGYETARKNKSFTKSKGEDALYQYLIRFDPEVKRQFLHPQLKQAMDFYSPKYDKYLQFDGTYWHGKGKTLEEVQEAVKKGPVSSRIGGVLTNMINDIKQNEKIPNLIRIWEDDFYNMVDNNIIEIYLMEKLNG